MRKTERHALLISTLLVGLLLTVAFALSGCGILPQSKLSAEVSPTLNNPTVITRPTVVMVDCGSSKPVNPIKNGNAL